MQMKMRKSNRSSHFKLPSSSCCHGMATYELEGGEENLGVLLVELEEEDGGFQLLELKEVDDEVGLLLVDFEEEGKAEMLVFLFVRLDEEEERICNS